MKTHLVSFATPEYLDGLRWLAASARRAGIDEIRCWDRVALEETAFYRLHRDVLDCPRGAGYWLWKPFIIHEQLRQAETGDLVIYADAGQEIVGDLTPLLQLCVERGGVLIFDNPCDDVGAKGPNLNRRWTRRDCFVLMDCDEPCYHDARQVDASFVVFMKCKRAVALVREWLLWCCQRAVVSDDANQCGLPDLEGFIEHRHDQSVLALLRAREELDLFRCPSERGNHQKLEELRVPGEYLAAPYGRWGIAWNSPYGTLLRHHHQRSDRRPLLPELRADMAPTVARARAALAAVPRRDGWQDPASYAASLVGYGLPEWARPLINLPLGDDATYADLLVHLAGRLRAPIHYLELGVSVGKTLLTVSGALRGAQIWGYDIEDIHPTLRGALTAPRLVSRWPGAAPSPRRTPSSHTRFRHAHNTVHYLAADIFDGDGWRQLAGRRFNLILSDAVHTPAAVQHEATMLELHELLDPGGFVMIWDDLGGAMTAAFWRIWRRLQERFEIPEDGVHLGRINGWLGQHEAAHLVGVVMHLPEDSGLRD